METGYRAALIMHEGDDFYVVLVCALNFALWGRLAFRASGWARRTLLAALAFHTCVWRRALRHQQLPRGYRAVCAREVAWTSFGVTEEALASEEVWRSPPFYAYGEEWCFKTRLNHTDEDGQSFVSAYLARTPPPGDRRRPRELEFSLQLGTIATEPAVHDFGDWPFNAGMRRFVTHDEARDMLRSRSRLMLSATVLHLDACARFTQLAFASAEAAALATLVWAGE